VRKSAVAVVLATAGLGLLAPAAGANPLVSSAVLADSAGSRDAIKVTWYGGRHWHGHHFHPRFYGRYGYYRYGYRPYPRYGMGWGYGGRHHFY
jgi:hypothetical protein